MKYFSALLDFSNVAVQFSNPIFYFEKDFHDFTFLKLLSYTLRN